MFPGQSCLSNPVMCGYVNPREEGFITRLALSTALPRISLNLQGVDFDGADHLYEFGIAVPPASDFEAVILEADEVTPVNVNQISYISIYDAAASREIFGPVTITTTPAWPDSTFTSDVAQPYLSTAFDAGAFPGLSTVITFRNVPVTAGLAIQFYGNSER